MRIIKRLSPALSELIPLLGRYRRRLLIGCLWLLLTNLTASGIPWILKSGVDSLKTEPSQRIVLLHAGAIILAAVIGGYFLFLMRRWLIGASREMEFDLRNRFFSHLQTLSQDFFLRHPTGDLMARATNDLSAVRDVLGPGIMYFLNTIASVSMALVLMFRIDPMLTAVAVLPFPILAFAVQRFAVTLHIRSRDVQDQFGVMNNMLQEDLSGIRVIKSYVKESQEQELFARLNEDYRDKNLSLIRARALFFATMALLVGVGQLILLWLGGIRIMGGQISLGGFVAFNGYLALMTWPFIALGWVMAMVQRGEASMARLAEIINATPTIISPPSAHHSRTTHGELVFENVSLVYPGATHPSLEDVSFTIPTGATVAIVGRTGSGKSSLIRLAVRLFDPTKGRILLDGIDLKEWDLASLRKKIGVVLQESFLWSDTLAGNLRFADPEAAEEDLDRVSALARLDKDMNQFPEGWETRVGERGVTLSGGQRQRVALA
ncbi:MAG: ATP-binding cassette domain-containing protein, partial [Candidatus Eisenbacteria bacterium]|nr:ATP-binding cassette domain-containing protein [Candidatus Eisenbacteria bacterium]